MRGEEVVLAEARPAGWPAPPAARAIPAGEGRGLGQPGAAAALPRAARGESGARRSPRAPRSARARTGRAATGSRVTPRARHGSSPSTHAIVAAPSRPSHARRREPRRHGLPSRPARCSLVAPPFCWDCGARGAVRRAAVPPCRARLRWLDPEPVVARRGARLWAPVAYEGPARALVRGLKYRGARRAGRAAGGPIAAGAPAGLLRAPADAGPGAAAPAPGVRRRGFNQAERLAARAGARAPAWRCATACSARARRTRQVGRDRAERLERLAGADSLRAGRPRAARARAGRRRGHHRRHARRLRRALERRGRERGRGRHLRPHAGAMRRRREIAVLGEPPSRRGATIARDHRKHERDSRGESACASA